MMLAEIGLCLQYIAAYAGRTEKLATHSTLTQTRKKTLGR